ncbi:AraC family transcriptional regulator [Shewanella schlegeliana]|uniref:Helix-turn-helix domain-containing protein n=1 Tax=Shewanella schlegeliana TaxID=190308 RepID=A0ABS1SX33_9GAMM|nr:AraC family transcriptional regulator [Shewanella schlegeliana]MBL4913113.1 helix-turn-helix domain-containing protein [Shewanella schlegeliana]MCL1111127.1 AraC family transcriptional regulator [Shewanella schlegeliana]GIU28192.1 AraC family transcriptional regulator [Shewanella schlegeliana]
MDQPCSYKPHIRVGDQSYPAYELKNLFRYLKQNFSNEVAERLYSDIGIGESELMQSQFVYVWQVDYAMNYLRQLSPDLEIAAKAASSYKVAQLDVLLPHLAKFNTLGECLQFAISHPELVGSFSDNLLRNDDGRLYVRWLNTNKVDIERYSFQFQHSICSLLAFAKELTGENIRVSHIALAEPVRVVEFLSAQSGADISFDSEFFEWSIEHRYLALPVTYSFEQAVANQRTETSHSYISQVLTILRELAPELPSMDAMADRQSISARTLRRRLASANTSYQKLVDQVRCQMAIDLILTSDYSIDEISDLMGFGDVSHFRQSFKHWIGHPPGHFHRLNSPLIRGD